MLTFLQMTAYYIHQLNQAKTLLSKNDQLKLDEWQNTWIVSLNEML